MMASACRNARGRSTPPHMSRCRFVLSSVVQWYVAQAMRERSAFERGFQSPPEFIRQDEPAGRQRLACEIRSVDCDGCCTLAEYSQLERRHAIDPLGNIGEQAFDVPEPRIPFHRHGIVCDRKQSLEHSAGQAEGERVRAARRTNDPSVTSGLSAI